MKDTVTNSWKETEYRLDVWYVAHRAHIKSVQASYKILGHYLSVYVPTTTTHQLQFILTFESANFFLN
jgi:hypothetical protein